MRTDSVARAKAHRDTERQAFEQATGVRVSDDGILQFPHRVCCGLCGFTAEHVVHDRAIYVTAVHILTRHLGWDSKRHARVH